MGSAGPPLAVYCLYGGRHRQHRRLGAPGTSRLDRPLGTRPARVAHAHGALHVRAALCREVENQTQRRRSEVMVGKTFRKSAKVARARIKERVTLKGVGWKKPMSIAAEKYEAVSKAIIAVLPARPIKFTVLAKLVEKQVPNFEGSIAWYTVSVARALEAEGKLIRQTKPVLYSKPGKQQTKATSRTPGKYN